MTVPFMYNFLSLSNKSLRFSGVFFFPHFTPQVRIFFVEKKKPKTFGFKNLMESEKRKILTFVMR